MNWIKSWSSTYSVEELSPSARRKLEKHAQSICVRTDRMFAVLMALQWIGGIITALVISPRTWIGAQSDIHPHLMMAIFGGFVLAALPIAMAIVYPGRLSTRMVIASSQVLFSALLIHLSGGRIETHFHVFGSLAFLAAYRDPRVLVPATLLVAVDHLVRGLWWPESVFGIATASEWRWLEHAAWVVFEDVFLVIVIWQSCREMRELAHHTAALEVAANVAERANRTKSKFLANMSHEIRTPLNAIIGFTEMLVRDRSRISAEEQDEHLRTINHSGQHLLALINDVLDLSKIEAGQLHVESVPCSPHQVISETVSVLRVSATEKGISLDYRWESEVPKCINTDPSRLKQLLLNLIGNAIKFTDRGSVLIVARTDRNGQTSELVVEVRDTGIGIRQDKLDGIFQPFVQADDSVTRQYGGTGLGLAIGRKTAEALGGSLSVSSVVGQGSTFVLRIAIGDLETTESYEAPLAKPGASQPEPAGAPCDLGGLRVLVVDDGAMNRKLARFILERVGVEVQEAENGQVALDVTDGASFDAILMDMQMPVIDGYTATARLRERGLTVPIIACTAHAMKGDRAKCEQAGCSRYLSKPIDADLLYDTLAQARLELHDACCGEDALPCDRLTQCDPGPISSLLKVHDRP